MTVLQLRQPTHLSLLVLVLVLVLGAVVLVVICCCRSRLARLGSCLPRAGEGRAWVKTGKCVVRRKLPFLLHPDRRCGASFYRPIGTNAFAAQCFVGFHLYLSYDTTRNWFAAAGSWAAGGIFVLHAHRNTTELLRGATVGYNQHGHAESRKCVHAAGRRPQPVFYPPYTQGRLMQTRGKLLRFLAVTALSWTRDLCPLINS